MSHLARRSLFLAAGACLVAAPDPAQAGGGHGLFHHHGYSYQSTTTTSGVLPAATLVGVAPAATYTSVMAAPMAFPAVTMAPMAIPTATFGFPTMTAASAVPSMSVSLPAASPVSAGLTPTINAAQQQAFAAPIAHASFAASNFPNLAQAAQRQRSWDGGRFVVFLRNLIHGLAGQNGSSSIAILRPILQNFIRTEIGLDPGSSGIAAEIERLLGEMNGGEAGTTGDGRCFTIRVCIDGGTPRVVGGEGGSVPPVTNGGSSPGLSLPPATPPSPQSPPSGQAQSGDSGDKVPPAPLAPSPVAPADGEAAKRHEQVMGAFADLGATLKEIRDSLNKQPVKSASAAQ